MSIFVRYGNYSHAEGEVEYSVSNQVLLTAREVAYAYRTRVQMRGLLMGSDPADMDQKVRALKAAYSRSDRNWLVMHDGQPLDISIYANQCISGVTVEGGVAFPNNKGAVYVTHVPYEITLTADVAIDDTANTLRSFEESLSFSGGGPRYLHIETATGFPVKQIGRRFTVYKATQQGSAVGLYRRPDVPRPIWPRDLVENPDYSIDGGNLRGSVVTDLTTTWNYRFESARPLRGSPNTWGRT